MRKKRKRQPVPPPIEIRLDLGGGWIMTLVRGGPYEWATITRNHVQFCTCRHPEPMARYYDAEMMLN